MALVPKRSVNAVNIGCALSKQSVRCDVARKFWRPPPKPSSCPVDWGNGLTLGRQGKPRYTCAGDTVLGQGRKLAYGKSVSVGRFRCTSRKGAMRCINRRNNHGFELSRERARRF
ncbi:MAG: hypothetical protein H0U32_05370 [Thermoleophilaceae bacterium]|nr:hypothetical protein [Thermoleophilaceae bacterium]